MIHHRQKSVRAFTMVELLVLLATVAILGCVFVSAAPNSIIEVQNILCLNGKKQLGAAWHMYADDNTGKLVHNAHGALAAGGSGGAVSWATGWLDWTTATDNTNVALLVNQKYGMLAPYVRGATNIFKCPADKYLSAIQKSRGWLQRVRSVSANIGVGEGNAETGPWASIYKHVKKMPEFLNPAPAETWVFLDEHPDSINDPAFFSPFQTDWIDLPAIYHNDGTAFAFADSHAEIQKWNGSLTKVTLKYSSPFSGFPTLAGDPDIHWMSYHTARVSTNSY